MEQTLPPPNPAKDALRLQVAHASFRLADAEVKRRAGKPVAAAAAPDGPGSELEAEATILHDALARHFAALAAPALETLRLELAQALLRAIDRRMAGTGELPGERPDLARLEAAPVSGVNGGGGPRVGLVSLPWMSPAMPSIQLATLASALAAEGIESDVHELYVDFAARIGLNLFNHLGNLLGFFPEWVFSRHYYGPEHGDDLAAMLERRPLEGLPWPELEAVIPDALDVVTADYLDRLFTEVDWSRYDVIGCSLTISQLGSSMAFARRLKLAHPEVRVVFGGSQCAGIMGRTILKVCPFVDVVVHVEGEVVLPELVRRLRAGAPLAELAGVRGRLAGAAGEGSEIARGAPGELYRPNGQKLPLGYDFFFLRLQRLGLLEKVNPWLPFESSRGCWYGQKSQCTFCGLHEIMEFRAWDADLVLAELERLRDHYGIGRFYSMDLILPREYLRTLLPTIVERGHDWMFFYEIKSNVRREEVKLLAESGIRWVQPGIESLDAEQLKLMRKGVSPLQNVMLLKWCEEFRIFCGWNLLHGLPGETNACYRRMEALIPKILHLRPPTGGGQFQLHRFSPYFDHPEHYGIRWKGAHEMFRYAFPIPQADLDDLVYLHEFELVDETAEALDVGPLIAATSRWRRAYREGASLRQYRGPDGASTIEDRRRTDASAVVHALDADETLLYDFLDGGVGQSSLEAGFAKAWPAAARRLGRRGGLAPVLERWLAADLVLAIDGRLASLAIPTAPAGHELDRTFPQASEGMPHPGAAPLENPTLSV